MAILFTPRDLPEIYQEEIADKKYFFFLIFRLDV